MLQTADSNKDGLVAVIENENEIALYAGSQFFEDGQT